MVLGNDYEVWVSSSQQTSNSREAVLLLVTEAEGNVKDNTNLRVVSFEYGLPTATQILGTTIELNDLMGFDIYGEYDISYSYTKYPNIARQSHSDFSGIKGARTAPSSSRRGSRARPSRGAATSRPRTRACPRAVSCTATSNPTTC